MMKQSKNLNLGNKTLCYILPGKLIETEDQQEDGSDGEKANSSSSKLKTEGKESEGPPTLTFVKQISTGDILVKRNFADSSDTIHLRKTIRLSSDAENRSMVQIKQEFIKKGDNENQILIPIKFAQTSDLVKDIQNTLIVNKNNKTVNDKKHGVHNQNVSSLNCIRQNVSDGDSNSFLKARRIKLDDVMNESSKKFKKNEC